MNNSITKAAIAALICLTCAGFANAQESGKNTEGPKVVTPGNIKTNSAPSDAIVLFDGKDLSAWKNSNGGPAEWNVHDGIVTVNKKAGDILTKQNFENFQLHVEWCVPKDIEGSGQSRGNSGIYLQDKYEIQVLDSYNNTTYFNGMAGSVYSQKCPLVNAMRKPGEWNVYDIIYSAPIFKEDGTFRIQPQVTVFLNGILVQQNALIEGLTTTNPPKVVKHGAGPIRLQAHGDPSKPISYRNIWIRVL